MIVLLHFVYTHTHSHSEILNFSLFFKYLRKSHENEVILRQKQLIWKTILE